MGCLWFWHNDLAIVDVDLHDGARALLTTAGGALPVIAIAGKERPRLSSTVRHLRIGATLTKPVSPENCGTLSGGCGGFPVSRK